MAMRFCSLGSGSTGNASLIEVRSGSRTTRLLLDCGFSQRELASRLARAGTAIGEIDAIFVTHEHGDHVGCALGLSRRHRIPLWTSRGTWRAISGAADEDAATGAAGAPVLRLARDGDAIECGDIVVMPYTVPHDANEPLQIVVGDGSVRLGVLTDAGCMTGHIVERLSGCAALLLECNHDPELLRGSAYPPALKARIGGRLGHLSNGVAGDILAATVHGGLRHIVAAHLSERNNTPQLARAALAKASGAAVGDIVVADPQQGTGWLEIG